MQVIDEKDEAKEANKKNANNKLKLSTGKHLLMLELKEGITVAIPTTKALSNIRVLDIEDDGTFTAHWTSNFNLSGDFRTEVMRFDADLVLDEGDKTKRNNERKAHGLMPIK